MRILFLRSNPVDPEPRVEKEANTLKKNGFSSMILCWDRNSKHEPITKDLELLNSKIKITRIGIKSKYGAGFPKNLFPLLKFQIKLFKWLRKNNNEFDAIHACDLDTALVACICSKILHKKFVYDIFDYYVDSYKVPPLLKKIIENIDRYVISNADTTIICSEKRKEQIAGAKPRDLAIIHNSPNEALIKKNISWDTTLKSNTKTKLVYVGVLQDGRFLKELAEIVVQKKNCELHLGGYGKYEKYFKVLSEKYENIFFYGKLSYLETLELENNCDLMTAIYDPEKRNHYYAAPNKFYEALMLGKPLIMIKNTGMSELVEKNNIGKVIEFNKNDLSQAIDELIEKKDFWKDISYTMKKLYKEKYCWELMEKRLISIYQN